MLNNIETQTAKGLAYQLQSLNPSRTTIVESLKFLLKNFVKRQILDVTLHPLGFCKFSLFHTSEYNLRLHIWLPQQRPIQNVNFTIHNHIWDLTSHILLGKLYHNTYEIKTDMTSPTHKEYDVLYENNKSIMIYTNRMVTCVKSKALELEAGTTYQMFVDEYHDTIVPDNLLTATLVLTTFKTQTSPIVLGPIDGESKYIYDREVDIDFQSDIIVERFIESLE